jgi:hypothetical protein
VQLLCYSDLLVTPPFWLLLLALAIIVVVVRVVLDGRARAVARLRAEWGQRSDREYRLDAIADAHRSRAAGEASAVLDDRTWNDLHLDDVFAVFDRTMSTLGQHALYHRLREVPEGRHLESFEALVTRMADDAAARERAQLALGRLTDPRGYDLWWLGQRDVLPPQRWYVVFPMLALLTLGVAVALPFRPSLFPLFLLMVAINIGVRNATDRDVRNVAVTFRQLAPVIAVGQKLGFLEGPAIDAIVAPLRTDAPGLSRLKTIARWVSGDPFMLSVQPGPFAVVGTDLVSVVYDYLNFVFLLDVNGVYFGAGELRARGTALLRVMAAAGDVDAAISVASYRASHDGWTRPGFRPPGAEATLTDVWHPLVDQAVPNSMVMPPGRGVLVTGSNMSGKTTFLRTVGVNAVLAQTIHTCLATEYAAPMFHVRSCIGRSDDLLAGKSYYIVEVESLIGLVQASQRDAPHLILLDELFRGTNAVERIAAGQAVLRELVTGGGAARHVVIAATHDGELVDLLPDLFAAVHFGDAVVDDTMVFDHRLQPGPATSRNAIALLRMNGAPDRMVQNALECAVMLDGQRAASGR